jgi:hypothetical protein
LRCPKCEAQKISEKSPERGGSNHPEAISDIGMKFEFKKSRISCESF